MDWDNILDDKNSKLIYQILLGIILAILSFVIFAKLADTVFEKETILFDSTFTNYIYTYRNPVTTKIMIYITDFGSYGVAILSLVFTIILFLKKYYKLSFYFAFIVGSGFVANALLKLIVQRQRPNFMPLVTETDFSFPSGHTMGAFIFFTTVVYFFYHLTRKKFITSILLVFAILITFVIGLSRIYLGVHYPSDILGGIVAGFLWVVGIITANKIYKLIKISKN